MKLGVIIICRNNEAMIDKETMIKKFGELSDLEVCFVNNGSTDKTYEALLTLQEYCEGISVVNISKGKPELTAVRAGARYMINKFNLKGLGYITRLDQTNLETTLQFIEQNRQTILEINGRNSEPPVKGFSKFKNLFSIPARLELIQKRQLLLPQFRGAS